MISVTLFKEGDNVIGYRLTGHADQGPNGQDIVCAGVSTLSIAALNTLTDVCRLSEFVHYEVRDGFLSVHLNSSKLSAQEMHDAQIALRGMELAMIDLAKQYPKAIKITYKEVSHDSDSASAVFE
ncbi:MAG: ribosomal-processing cysteine protease Prp [Ndongobacter sp.]|nr:ribosomal-processing cysteine protease Prp [Ndongobacter sp.]